MDKKGLIYALVAYSLWGVLPIYWKQLDHVPALEVLLHRIVWSLLFLAILLVVQKPGRWIRPLLRDRRTLLTYAAATVLLTINWGIYIWAVNTNHIVETSLGYFINPLVSVLLGMLFLGERLRPGQWAAIGLATVGVIYFLFQGGELVLWIALVLAFSFGFYGLIKKRAPLDALKGLSLETFLIAVPSAVLLLIWAVNGEGAMGRVAPQTDFLLIASGAATAVPLLFFGAAAPRIPLRMIGILQYVAPSIQFLLGVFVYGETFNQSRFIGFCIIWAALLLFTIENLTHSRSRRTAEALLRSG